MRIPFFRIFYSTTYTLLFIVTICLIILTPADAVYQSYRVRNVYSIVSIAAVYLSTGVLAVLIYVSRLYTNRSIVASIPKPYIPIEKEDVGKNVRTLIADGLERNAIIAYQARPKDIDDEEEESLRTRMASLKHGKDRTIHPNSRTDPTWGTVSHPGWSSPSSPDLPDLQYDSVIAELPNLIEAKAVSLAPADPLLIADMSLEEEQHDISLAPDARVVEVLQRPATMGLRQYIIHLTSLGLISPPTLGSEFLSLYERARFSAHALEEYEFRSLMGVFAEILRSMKELDPHLVAELQAEDFSGASLSSRSISDRSSEVDSVYFDGNGGAHIHRSGSGLKPSNWSTSSSSGPSIRTAPLVQVRTVSRGSPADSRRGGGTPSERSLRHVASNVSRTSGRSGHSAGSVIRLAEARQPLELPYVIQFPGREEDAEDF